MVKVDIHVLKVCEYMKCGNIWNMQKNAYSRNLAERFLKEIKSGNRKTFVSSLHGEFIAEASLVRDMGDPQYTQEGKRIYFSRFLVKDEFRGKGIGTELAEYVFSQERSMGYTEISVGVDYDNWDALRLYHRLGFTQLLFTGEDEQGKYMKLLKYI